MVDIPALLKAYGAPDNAANVNALTQRYASDPTAAERKIYGLQGQSDESGGSRDAILNMMIDQVAQQSVPAPQPQALPVSPMVQNSSVPTRRSATAGRVPGANYNTEQNLGPLPARNASAGERSAVPGASTAGTSDWDWLLGPLLGILGGGAVAGATMRGKGGPAAAAGRAVSEFRGPEATYVGPMNKEVGPATTRTRTDRLGNDNSGAPPTAASAKVADTGAEGRAIFNDMKNARTVDDVIAIMDKYPTTPMETIMAAAKQNNTLDTKQIDQVFKMDNRAPSQVTGSPENEVLARKAQVQAELDAANAEGNAIMNQLKGRKQFKPAGAMRNATGRAIRK